MNSGVRDELSCEERSDRQDEARRRAGKTRVRIALIYSEVELRGKEGSAEPRHRGAWDLGQHS